MFDYHMHSTVSYDGHSTSADMARAAEAAGLKEICFTEHLDYLHCVPRKKTAFTVEQYIAAHGSTASRQMRIRFGAEVGLAPWNVEEIRKDLTAYPYDFVIGSVHFIDEEDPYLPPYWVGKDPLQAERKYFEETLKCVQLHEDFDVLGHMTYISKCPANPCRRRIPLKEYQDIIAQIMKVLIAKGKGIEINTSGIDRCGDYLPGLEYVRLFRDLGGEIVTIGSDAHAIDRVGQYCADGCVMLKEVFGHVCTFEHRKPIFHML